MCGGAGAAAGAVGPDGVAHLLHALRARQHTPQAQGIWSSATGELNLI